MMLRAFSVFDTKGQMFGVPFFMGQIAQAIRAFGDLANDPGTMVARHPADFILYEIGNFDDSTGQLVSFPNPINLGHGTDYVKPGPQMPLMLGDLPKAAE